MSPRKFWPVYISVGLFAVGVILFVTVSRWSALPLSLDPKNVATVFAPLTLAAAFIERAVEVVISPWRDLDASKLDGRLGHAKAKATLITLKASGNLAAAATSVDPAVQSAAAALAQESTQEAADAQQEVVISSDALADYRGQTKQYAYAISLLLGLLVAYCGIWGLANLCGQNAFASVGATQKRMFDLVDVILSAAVLAGGANGIHSIVTAVTTFADSTSQKAKQSANG